MTPKSTRVLLSWIGNSDLRAVENMDENNVGPIARTVADRNRNYTHIYLLNDHAEEEGRLYQGWLENRCQARIAPPLKVDLRGGPMDYRTIYQESRAAIEKIYTELKSRNIPLTYLVSAGTSAMSAMLIILAKTSHPATLVEAYEKGVKTVSFPFDLAAELLPDVFQHDDDKFSKLAQGLVEGSPDFRSIIGKSSQLEAVKNTAALLAIRDVPVLILGESGTGKELFARAIHSTSSRKRGPCVCVNCGAIPETMFEAEFFGYKRGAFTGALSDKVGHIENAHNGTLFLDEIGELPLEMQVKLLRVLGKESSRGQVVMRMGESTERNVNFRLIAATNQDLREAVRTGKFREDLLYRIAVGVLQLPPLRERAGDPRLLSNHFLDEINRRYEGEPLWQAKKLSPGALNLIQQHSWPGNVRELMNTISRVAIETGGEIIGTKEIQRAFFNSINLQTASWGRRIDQTPDAILGRPLGEGFCLDKVLNEVSIHYLQRAHQQTNGRKAEAARLLGFKVWQTYEHRRKKLGLT